MTTTYEDPDQFVDIKDLIAEVIDNPEEWLDRPHPLLGLAKPRDLIGTDREASLRDLARAIKYGVFS